MMRHGRMFDGIDVVPILLQAGADLEARDNLGHTVLLRSLTDLKAVKKLLDLGAKVGARDIYGNSVLHLICQNPFSQDILRLLVEAGADLTWVNHEGNTILHETSKPVLLTDHLTQVRFLEVLLQLGVAVAQKNYSGATPLHITCSSRPNSGSAQIWKAIIDLLLGPKFGIGINEGDNNGIRAIHLAATISEQLVHWLVDAGADPAVRTREGQTPLQVACRARQTNVVGMLWNYIQREPSLI
jgi:ankyrin repeat protein